MARLVADQRSLMRLPAVLTWRPIDGAGAAATISVTVTVTVTRDDGSALVANQATTGAAERTYALPVAHTGLVDILRATWFVDGVQWATTSCEIVGRHLASIPELTALEPKIGNGASQWTPAEIIRAMNETTDEFEDACGVAFAPRFAREVIRVDESTPTLRLSWPELRSVRSASYTWPGGTPIALSVDQLASIKPSTSRLAVLTDGSCWPGGSTVEIRYEHGYDRPSARLVRAFSRRVAERLMSPNSALPGRATSTQSPEGLTIQLASADPTALRWTGNLDVDAVLSDERRLALVA